MSFFSSFKHYKEGSYEFQLDTRKKVAYISGHTDGSAIIHLPSEVIAEGVTYTIVGTNMLAFHDDLTLEELYVPDSYESFDYCTLENCPKLWKIHLGKSFGAYESPDLRFPRIKLGSWDVDRTSLQEVTIDPENPYIKMSDDGLFILSKSGKELIATVRDVEEITVPEGITWIGVDALHGLSKLKTIHLPSSLMGIGENRIRKRDNRDNKDIS